MQRSGVPFEAHGHVASLQIERGYNSALVGHGGASET
jgi:hypothetical protein